MKDFFRTKEFWIGFAIFFTIILAIGIIEHLKPITGKYKNSDIIYNFKSDGTYDYIALELVDPDKQPTVDQLNSNADDLPKKEVIQGHGHWERKTDTIFLQGPGLKRFEINNGRLLALDEVTSQLVYFDKY
ncbi:MAG TPA: hypothetical protein VG367_07300 [Mucilaginibacter sp.]|jgi:hypothetical protein|nr:hypothetical protein [Mucilaginibacter sp.]